MASAPSAQSAWDGAGNSQYWQLKNFASLQVQLIVTLSICSFLGLLFTGLRLWSRQIKSLNLVPNDYLLVAACFFNIIFMVNLLISVFLGSGAPMGHSPELNPMKQQSEASKTHIASGVFWALVNTLVKLSMADLYTRIFPSRTLKKVCIVFSVVSLLNFLLAVIVAGFSCKDGGKAFQLPVVRSLYMGIGIINLLLDICVIVIPLPPLWQLQLKLEKKLSLIGIFTLGFVITAISAVRVEAFSVALKDPMGGKGLAYNSFAMPFWSFLETSLSVVNACLPVIFPALLAIGKRLTSGLSSLSLISKIRHSVGSRPSEQSTGASFTGTGGVRQHTSKKTPWTQWPTANDDDGEPTLPRHRSDEVSEKRSNPRTKRERGGNKWKDAYYLEKTRLDDEESIESASEHSLKREKNAHGIVVNSEWTVEYGSRRQ